MLHHNQQQLRDVTLIIGSVHTEDADEGIYATHAVSNIVRADLEADSIQLEAFIKHVVDFEGVVHHDLVKS